MIDLYLTDAVEILDAPEKDKWGSPVSSPEWQTVRARIEWKTRLVRDATGAEVASSVCVYLVAAPGYGAFRRVVRHRDTQPPFRWSP